MEMIGRGVYVRMSRGSECGYVKVCAEDSDRLN